MSIRFFCPLGHPLKVPDERAGKKGRCPICRQRLIVPEVSMPAKKHSLEAPWASIDQSPVAFTAPADEAVGREEPPASSADVVETAKRADQTETIASSPAAIESVSVAPAPSLPAPTIVGAVPEPTAAEPIAASSISPAPPVVAPPPLPFATAPSSRNGTLAHAPPAQPAPSRRLEWAVWTHGEDRASVAIIRPTPRQLEMVYWLACLLPFAAVFCAAPAVPHIQFAGAPFWAQALLGIACLQCVYAAWLATVPDWSAVRVGMYLLAGIAAVDFLAALFLPLMPAAFLSLLGLAGLRSPATAWCGLAAIVNGLSSAACRWLEERWRTGRL